MGTPTSMIQGLAKASVYAQLDHNDVGGTKLPADGKIKELSQKDLYLYLTDFYQKSDTFRHYWNKSQQVQRSGANTEWNSLADNACMVIQTYRHLIEDDSEWFFNRCPFVEQGTYQKIVSAVKDIDSNPKMRELFYLFMYARDFGWADTGQGQFHQTKGKPIVEQILKELKYPAQEIQKYVCLQGDHSMPAEIFLGEVSSRSVQELIDKYGSANAPSLLQMLSCLSLFEVNCIKKDASAVYKEIASVIIDLADPKQQEKVIHEANEKRLDRLGVSAMKFSNTPVEKQKEIAEASLKKKQVLEETIRSYSDEDQIRIQRLLQEVDLHYIAATFPKMSPEAIARFLKISAQQCFPDVNGKAKSLHVINMRQDLSNVLDKELTSKDDDSEVSSKLTCINQEGWIVWIPMELSSK